MSFNYNGYSLADLSVIGVSGRPGLGVAQLCFSVDLRIPPTAPPNITIRNIKVDVRATLAGGKSDASFLGTGFAEGAFEIVTGRGTERSIALFCVVLTEGQIQAIDVQRQGGAVAFDLTVSAMANGPVGGWQQTESLKVTASPSDWAEVSAQMAGPEYFVISLPIPRCDHDHPMSPAIERIKNARGSLAYGRYDAVVSDCRLALETILRATGRNDAVAAAVNQWTSTRRSMTKHSRENLLLEVLRHYTHAAHHVDANGVPDVFSRDDAQLALSATTSFVSAAIARYDAGLDGN